MDSKDLICYGCIHFHPLTGGCAAFPVDNYGEGEGIPAEILMGKNDHSKPIKGQGNDIVFTPGDPQEYEKLGLPL